MRGMKPIANPPNPFASHDCKYFEGMVPPAKLEIYEDATRTILAKNDSPDLGFRYSLNPYRGCIHACAYCYARPSHEYLGFGAGSDFETKILVKKRAAELLRETFMKRSWVGEWILFSGDTDCYQPLEASFKITRACLEVIRDFGNPIGIITKSFLITRDLELLKEIEARTHLSVTLSIPFLDDKMARIVEPHASSSSKRFEAVSLLASAGISVNVNLAPIIPGLNDSDIPGILKRAKECGAKSASPVLLRLPGNVKEVFISRLRENFPMAAEKIIARIREVRDGRLYNSQFGQRHSGTGEYWENIRQIFKVTSQKLELNRRPPEKARPGFRRPSKQQELALFN
jgi:DNA repair photolyase